MQESLLYIFTGEGKGKTTAAMGILLRAIGHNMRTCLIQFMKENESAELIPLKKLGVEIISSGAGFYKIHGDHNTEEIHRIKAQKALLATKEKILSKNYDIIVLDEINVAVSLGLVKEEDLMEILENRPKDGAHIILTGRDAPKSLAEKANLVSNVQEIKHPFSSNIQAQKGLEF